MKKIVASLMAIIISILVSLLLKNIIPTPDSYANDYRFITIEQWGPNHKVVYDEETKIEYLILPCSGGATATLLVNAEGKPLLYEGE
ncbi:MAG: DUF6440 family protein [Clostridium sp.]|nr:DUF6440 family protein [Clostridium sp.]